jgi:hypothetical protein
MGYVKLRSVRHSDVRINDFIRFRFVGICFGLLRFVSLCCDLFGYVLLSVLSPERVDELS